MANITTSADIKDLALFNAGEATDGTSDLDAQATIYLNRAYRELYMGGQAFDPEVNELWWWMFAEGQLVLEGNVTTGTVQVTNNSTTAEFSTTPTPTIDSDVTGWFFKVDDHEDIFRISSISSTTGTLDTVYTGDDDTAASYTLFKLEYDLSASAIKLLGPMETYQGGKYEIHGMALTEMNEQYPLARVTSGVPTWYAQVDEDTVRFNKWGSATDGTIIRVDYDYLTLPTALADDSNEPLIPLHYRHVLADMVQFYLLGDKEEQRQEFVGLQARNGIRAMAKENRRRWAQTGMPGHIYPRGRKNSQRFIQTTYEGTFLR